jgi:formamidopyrimidine-DNA glycosylase
MIVEMLELGETGIDSHPAIVPGSVSRCVRQGRTGHRYGAAMPELPEVETVRRGIAARLLGRRVFEAGSHPSAKFVPARDVVGATFVGAGRRGKYLLLGLDDGRELVVHLGMTGQLRFRAGPPDDSDPHLRAWWLLEAADGPTETLEFVDVRRFGRLRVVPAGEYSDIPTLANAGPEPWDPMLTDLVFWKHLRSSRRAVKTQLLSQRPIAGVGNIYADEALWVAEINPRVTRLGRERAARLLDALRTVLAQGVDNGGTTLRDYRNAEGGSGTNQYRLRAYGRGGQPCLRCGEPLRVGVIDARTTTWCPACQRR